MHSLQTETLSMPMEQQQQLNIEDGSKSQRAEWVLNSPEPPGLCHEIVSSIKSAVFPNGGKHSSSSTKQTRSTAAGVVSFLHGLFPILTWGRNYKATKFRNDLMAGLTLASLSIPQSIGYATLANLAPQHKRGSASGLCFNGKLKRDSHWTVAVVSLLLSSMIQNVVDPVANAVAYRKLVLTVTFFAGTFQFIFGLFRLGFLVDFLSHAAIVGFMGGAAIVIGLQQLKGLLGISHFTTKTDVVSVLEAVFRSLHHQGRRNKKLFWLPAIAPLISVVLSTAIVFLTKADEHGVKIVKHIKRGLNPISAHELQFSGQHVGQAAKIGLVSAIVALTEAIAVGRSFASIRGYHLDGNKEMVAMGFMNIAGSLTSCYVATGSFSRTAVNFSAGCETVVSNIVMAIAVFLSLELLTRLLYFTPIAILASIILSALPGLIDIPEAYHIWKVDKMDFLACAGAFFGVLFASVEIGLLAAVTISFAKIILNSIRPSVEGLGKLPGTDIFCDINQYPMAIKTPGILIVRINSGLLCFANANFVRERIMKRVTEKDEEGKENSKERTQAVILDMSTVMNIDTSGICALQEVYNKLVSHNINLAVANPRWQVIHKLKLAKVVDKIGKDWIFLSVGEAVDACSSKMVNFSSC
ncbi:Low affinity sulfate transporter 3 [Vitis vinifera]|uniref:Low affinity sulfate transporter 3 n=1 Tax=Vitis vinifera TaxID=29760 RepID=A0A438F849_VITVI|nr:Low affinity sulfate transporter 3 [Vitis vinifera]